MGKYLAKLLWVTALSGCSLIYNPSNLPDKGSMPPDAAIADANPALLSLDPMVKSSPMLFEGAGQGGSSPQVLVLFGMHITKGAKLTVTANQNPMGQVAIEVLGQSIADDGNSIAALVKAGYMEMVDESAPNAFGVLPLTITVTQDGAEPKTVAWDLKPLDELAAGMQPGPGTKLYSHADFTGDVIFAPGQSRAVIHAVGNIKIIGKVSADAADGTPTPGAGGCAGGEAAAAATSCFGGGSNAGGGGGFGTPGTDGNPGTAGPKSGDDFIAFYDGPGGAMNKGGGGGGGAARGGGGGGILELTAGGDLQVTMVSAHGAVGEAPGLNLGRGAGGGAGGSIVLRAGGTLTHPAGVSVAGGVGGGGTLGSGGTGGLGRWRYDAAVTAGAALGADGSRLAPRRGPMIVRPANPIFEDRLGETITITGENGAEVTVITQYPNNTSKTDTVTLTNGMANYETDLRIGLNTICVLVPDGNFAQDEAKNCIEVAFIP